MNRNGNSNEFSRQTKHIEIDVVKYQAMLDDSDVAESVKEQFIRDLWSVICGWVELGFNVSPVQQALNASPGVRDALDCKEFKEKQQSKQEADT